MTGGAHQIGFFHADVMPRLCSAFQPPAASHFLRKAFMFWGRFAATQISQEIDCT
jgi:hypothetical protein